MKDDIDDYIQALSNLLQRVVKNMFVKGHVENTICVIDCNGMGLLSLPINALKKIIHIIMLNFTCGLHKMYLLNPSWLIEKGWALVTNFIS